MGRSGSRSRHSTSISRRSRRWSGAVDDNGNQVHSRTWNLAFIGLPTVDKKKQHRLTLTGEEMTQLVANTAPPYQMEAALLAGSDVHEGDAEDASPDDSSPKAFDDIVTMRRLG